MYLLTYYDDLKTLITPIGPPYLQADMAKDAMKRAILEYLKNTGVLNQTIFMQVQKNKRSFILMWKVKSNYPFLLFTPICVLKIKNLFCDFSDS